MLKFRWYIYTQYLKYTHCCTVKSDSGISSYTSFKNGETYISKYTKYSFINVHHSKICKYFTFSWKIYIYIYVLQSDMHHTNPQGDFVYTEYW